MKKRRQMAPISKESAERAVKSKNFWLAFEMLCTKVGKTKEFYWYIRRRNADATISQISDFKRKMTRLLAFNYDVHKCPNPVFCARLKPADNASAEPLIYPPEWKEEK